MLSILFSSRLVYGYRSVARWKSLSILFSSRRGRRGITGKPLEKSFNPLFIETNVNRQKTLFTTSSLSILFSSRHLEALNPFEGASNLSILFSSRLGGESMDEQVSSPTFNPLFIETLSEVMRDRNYIPLFQSSFHRDPLAIDVSLPDDPQAFNPLFIETRGS